MPLTTTTLELAAEVLGLELDGRKAGDDPARTAELAGARLELLLELRQRADAAAHLDAVRADAAAGVRARREAQR